MSTVVLVITDLMFQPRVGEQARALGHEVTIADTTRAALEALAAPAALVVLDLHADGVDWRRAVEAARAHGTPVLAFGRHTEVVLLREAREAGCDRVVPRSTLVAELGRLIEELAERRG